MPRAEMRASHEDHDIIVDQLRIAAGDGRIDGEELDQRIEAAMTARTYGELDVLIKDLPSSTQQASIARRTEAEASQSVTVTHGNANRRGAWLVPRQLVVTVRHGNVVLDFTQAVFHGPREVEIQLDVRHCNVSFVLPPGSIMSANSLATRHANVKEHRMGQRGAESVTLRGSGVAQHANIHARLLPWFAKWIRARRAAKEIGR